MPQTTLTPARGSSRRESTAGSSVTSLPSAKVRSSVRCGREVCPPLPLEQHVEVVGGAGERTLAQTDRADVDPGVGVQAEDAGDTVERAGLDRHQRAAGHDLLRRLEDQPHPAGQRVGDRGQRRARRRAGPRRARRGRRRAPRPGPCSPTGRRCGRRPGARPGRRAARPADRRRSRCRPRARCAAAATGPARPRRAAWRARPRCAPRPRRAPGGRAGRGVPRSAAPSAPPRRPARPGAGRPRRGPAQGST